MSSAKIDSSKLTPIDRALVPLLTPIGDIKTLSGILFGISNQIVDPKLSDQVAYVAQQLGKHSDHASEALNQANHALRAAS